MRIGFVTDNYKPYVSGVINFISLNRRYLEERGHEVWVFAFGSHPKRSADPRVVLSPGFKVRGTAGFHLGTRLTRRVHRLLATMDVVHVDDPFVSGRLALSVCRRHHVPVVFTNHSRVDLYPDYFLAALPSGSLDEALRHYMRRFCRRVDLVISPTTSMAQVLGELGVDVPIKVVRNGVDIVPFLRVARGFEAADALREAARARLGIARDDVVFVYTGRLSREKNLLLLVDALAEVAHRVPAAHLALIGDGPARGKIEAAVRTARLSRRVHFVGMVPYDEMPARLALCDVWVTASVTEVDPLTVIEAMAAGLAVVGPRAPGLTDTVVDGTTGLLAPPDDPGALAECMVSLAADAHTRRAMGDAAREASEHYAIEVTGAKMLGIYELLACEARAARPGSPAKAARRQRRPDARPGQ